MTKYIRSREKLIALIKDIFGVCDVSVDTKAIVLVLAGTLPSKNFKEWIDQVPRLNAFNANFKQINSLRWQYGEIFRNYALICAMQVANQDVCSDELQDFIANKNQDMPNDLTFSLEPRKLLFFSHLAEN